MLCYTLEVVTELQHTESDLSQELSETKEKLESLEKQYAIIQSDLLTLQNERDAVEEMKRHVEMQYQALSNDATDSESRKFTCVQVSFVFLYDFLLLVVSMYVPAYMLSLLYLCVLYILYCVTFLISI